MENNHLVFRYSSMFYPFWPNSPVFDIAKPRNPAYVNLVLPDTRYKVKSSPARKRRRRVSISRRRFRKSRRRARKIRAQPEKMTPRKAVQNCCRDGKIRRFSIGIAANSEKVGAEFEKVAASCGGKSMQSSKMFKGLKTLSIHKTKIRHRAEKS